MTIATASTREDRAHAFRESAREAGLAEVLGFRDVKPNASGAQNYDKLFVAPNAWRILSLEVWYLSGRAPYFKLTHSRTISQRCKRLLDDFGRRFERQGAKVVIHPCYVSIHSDLPALLGALARTLSGAPSASDYEAPPSPAVVVAPRQAAAPPVVPLVASGSLLSDAVCQNPWRTFESMVGHLEQLQALVEGPGVFARQPENAQLLPMTLSYCTPFRGSLFGESTLSGVAAALQDRRLDVLILGSNPNASELNADSPYGSLDEQLRSGLFGEAYFDALRRPRAGWTPQTDRKPGWRSLFRAVQDAGYRSDAVTMVNYLPWGSSQLHEFLCTLDCALRQRVVDFADLQLMRMLALLQPKVVIAVRSLSQTDGLHDSLPAKWSSKAVAASLEMPTVAGGVKRVHLLRTPASCTGGVPIIHMPHPGYLRLSSAAAPMFEQALARLMV
jgi:hypothetical protein